MPCGNPFATTISSPQHPVSPLINAFGLSSAPIETRSPYQGHAPEFMPCDGSPAAVQQQTAQAVQDLLEQGFAIGDIVILSGHGIDHSALLKQDKLGKHALKRFTGKYTPDLRADLDRWRTFGGLHLPFQRPVRPSDPERTRLYRAHRT